MGQLLSMIGIVGFCWGFWPLLMRSANVTGPAAAFVLSATAVLPIATLWALQPSSAPSGADLLKLMIAGLIMGFGMVAFNIAGTSRLAGIGTITSITQALTIVVVVVGSIAWFGEGVTPSKVIGTLLLVAGVLVLRPTG